jgi:hypothetical protein
MGPVLPVTFEQADLKRQEEKPDRKSQGQGQGQDKGAATRFGYLAESKREKLLSFGSAR